MADKNRRKSSILKIPKTAKTRAPLQDVDALEIKSSPDDEITSHTALRRRVSFAGKNFVKEFCAEADIASVFHAPEYEQLLLTSDSSNNTHSETVSDNNTTIQNGTQSSVFRSMCIQDDYDPCEQILKEYKGSSSSQVTSSHTTRTQKTRFSFGELQIPNFEAGDGSPVGSTKENPALCLEVPKQRDLVFENTSNPRKIDTKETIVQKVFPSPKSSSQSVKSSTVHGDSKLNHEKPFQYSVEDVQPADATQILNESMDFTTAVPCVIETNPFVRNVGCFPGGSGVMASEFNLSHSEIQITYASTDLTTALPSNIHFCPKEYDQTNLNHENKEENNQFSDRTVAKSETMDCTAALQSNTLHPHTHLTSEHIMESENFQSHSDSELMCSSMEFTTALPSNIQTHPEVNFVINRETARNEENCVASNKTVVMSTTMDFTSAMPSNIETHPEVNFVISRETARNEENCVASNKTVVMSTTMDFTSAMPSNIETHPEVNFVISRDTARDKENCVASNKTVVMSTTMDFTSAMPSNIETHPEVNFVISRDTGRNEENCVASNKTVVMSTTMDFTSAMPSNIQTHPHENFGTNIEIERNEENCVSSNKTVVVSTSMDLTRTMPSNIMEDPMSHITEHDISHSFGNEIRVNNDVSPHSSTKFMCTSMELTASLPTNIKTTPQENDKIDENIGKENNIFSNQSYMTCTTMEVSKTMPSNAQRNFGVENDHSKSYESTRSQKESIFVSNRTSPVLVGSTTQLRFGSNQSDTCQVPHVICMSREDTSTFSRDIQTQPILSETGIGNNFKYENAPLKSVANNTAENLAKPLSPIPHHSSVEASPEVCLRENKEAGETVCEVDDFPQVKELATSPSNDESGCRVLHQIPAVEQKTSVSKQKTSPSHHLDVNSQEVLKPADDDLPAGQTLKSTAPQSDATLEFDSISNPFESRPRLMSSPKKGEIESVVVQTSQYHVSTVGAPNSLPDHIVARDEEANPAKDGEESDDTMKYTTGSAGSAQTENVDSSNFSSSRPCLKSTPFKDASAAQTTPTIQVNFVESCQDGTEMEMDGVVINKSIVDGPLLDILAADFNLSDVQAPFHDYPSNSTLDNSGSVNLPPLQNAEQVEMLSTNIYSKDDEIRMPQILSDHMEYESNVSVIAPTAEPQQLPRQNLYLIASSEARPTLHVDNKSSPVRSRSTLGSEGSCSDKSADIYTSKRIRDSSQDNCESSIQEPLDSHVSKRKRNACSESKQTVEPSGVLPMTDPRSPLCDSFNKNSSDINSSDSTLSTSTVLSVDDIIYRNQKKHPICWEAVREGSSDLWTFNFHCTMLELKIHLKPSLLNGCIEAYSGYFHYNVNDSTKPIVLWGMKILQEMLSKPEWNSCLCHSTNFMSTLQKLVEVVFPVRKFIIEIIMQAGVSNIKISKDSLFFDVVSFKCHLWFQVHLRLDFWENYTPDHITIKNVVGTTRESEVKNLITGVKKDIYFLRNYVRDVKDYVRTLEEFCR
ncbi:Nuclear pore complex-interacting protein family member B11 [Frankliniella fusca]|uniref:Nuclear pore complex-interacting protein family member B11 n=1 Tax=Frankliniella fusca TaxID=407009 RepID=A0AAE1HHY0_9NEOP|nr:Nuclear pore complex-interacting protein family member B11 [Frankliniella fusca]